MRFRSCRKVTFRLAHFKPPRGTPSPLQSKVPETGRWTEVTSTIDNRTVPVGSIIYASTHLQIEMPSVGLWLLTRSSAAMPSISCQCAWRRITDPSRTPNKKSNVCICAWTPIIRARMSLPRLPDRYSSQRSRSTS